MNYRGNTLQNPVFLPVPFTLPRVSYDTNGVKCIWLSQGSEHLQTQDNNKALPMTHGFFGQADSKGNRNTVNLLAETKMMLTSIILAGGKGSRLGRCKLSESLCGKSLIEHVIGRLEPISNQILIVTAEVQSRLLITHKAEVVTHLYPGKGPLGGIYTGLLASKSPYSLVVGCDMPFLNISLLLYMISLIQGPDAIVPRLEMDKIEPLHAIYSRRCTDIIQTQLEHEHLKISQALDKLCIRYVERKECIRFDSHLLSFFNINSPADLRRATKITEGW